MKDIMSFRSCVQPRDILESSGEHWYGRLILRSFSYFLSYGIVKYTTLSANTITLVSIVVGTLACMLMGTGERWLMLIGGLCVQLWLLLDAVDGEVARGRGQSSVAGVYLDALGHYIVNPLIPAALFVAVSRITQNQLWFVVAIAAYAAGVLHRASCDMVESLIHKVKNANGGRYAIASSGLHWHRFGRSGGTYSLLVQAVRVVDSVALGIWVTFLSVAGSPNAPAITGFYIVLGMASSLASICGVLRRIWNAWKFG